MSSPSNQFFTVDCGPESEVNFINQRGGKQIKKQKKKKNTIKFIEKGGEDSIVFYKQDARGHCLLIIPLLRRFVAKKKY